MYIWLLHTFHILYWFLKVKHSAQIYLSEWSVHPNKNIQGIRLEDAGQGWDPVYFMNPKTTFRTREKKCEFWYWLKTTDKVGIMFMTIGLLDELSFWVRCWQLWREAREAAEWFVEVFERKDSENSPLYSVVL